MESYVDVNQVNEYAKARGIPFPEDSILASQRLVLATELFESYENKFKGYRTDPDQDLSWPRTNVRVRGRLISDSIVPNNIKNAVCQLACDIKTPKEIEEEGQDSKFAIKRTKTDVLETEYAVGMYPQFELSDSYNKFQIQMKDYMNGSFGNCQVIV